MGRFACEGVGVNASNMHRDGKGAGLHLLAPHPNAHYVLLEKEYLIEVENAM